MGSCSPMPRNKKHLLSPSCVKPSYAKCTGHSFSTRRLPPRNAHVKLLCISLSLLRLTSGHPVEVIQDFYDLRLALLNGSNMAESTRDDTHLRVRARQCRAVFIKFRAFLIEALGLAAPPRICCQGRPRRLNYRSDYIELQENSWSLKAWVTTTAER